MDEVNPSVFTNTSTYRIFNEYLRQLFCQNGFQVNNDAYDSTEYKYKAKYLRPFYEIHGVRRMAEVDVIGIPMNSSVLICMANVKGKDKSIKIKVNSNDSYDGMERKIMDDFIVKLIELSSPGIEDLPPELRLRILTKLPVQSVLNMSLLNNAWSELCRDDFVWKYIFERDFHCVNEQGSNWQQLYKNAYQRRKLEKEQKERLLRGRSLPMPPLIYALPPPLPLLPIGFGPYPYYDNLLNGPGAILREENLLPLHHNGFNFGDVM